MPKGKGYPNPHKPGANQQGGNPPMWAERDYEATKSK